MFIRQTGVAILQEEIDEVYDSDSVISRERKLEVNLDSLSLSN